MFALSVSAATPRSRGVGVLWDSKLRLLAEDCSPCPLPPRWIDGGISSPSHRQQDITGEQCHYPISPREIRHTPFSPSQDAYPSREGTPVYPRRPRHILGLWTQSRHRVSYQIAYDETGARQGKEKADLFNRRSLDWLNAEIANSEGRYLVGDIVTGTSSAVTRSQNSSTDPVRSRGHNDGVSIFPCIP